MYLGMHYRLVVLCNPVNTVTHWVLGASRVHYYYLIYLSTIHEQHGHVGRRKFTNNTTTVWLSTIHD